MPLPPQESILQKVVMTAFADRTVVTIAVSISPYTVPLLWVLTAMYSKTFV